VPSGASGKEGTQGTHVVEKPEGEAKPSEAALERLPRRDADDELPEVNLAVLRNCKTSA